ncbi:hypothetical protein [Maricaulis sp.]|uniref:hypothetical protein n=1 Tax=Maricaulis sp. TaxID=1486257 RepID=UPI00329971E5
MVLFVLRLVHTAVFAVCLTCLGLIAVYDLTGLGLVPALWALLPPALVGLGLLLNRGECILQTWARRLTNSGEAWARDVFFLPESWALRTVPVMLPLSLVLIAAIPVRYLFG